MLSIVSECCKATTIPKSDVVPLSVKWNGRRDIQFKKVPVYVCSKCGKPCQNTILRKESNDQR